MEIPRSGIVTQSFPLFENASQGRLRQRSKGRIGFDKSMVVRDDGIDLRLLQHDFRNEDAVGVARPPPGQVAAVFVIPTE